MDQVKPTAAAAPAAGADPGAGAVAADMAIAPEMHFTLDKIDLSLRKKPPPTRKSGKPILIDRYDNTLGKADPAQEIQRFKADVARLTDTRQQDLDVFLEDGKLWYRVRSKGVAGPVLFKDPENQRRFYMYAEKSYSDTLQDFGQKEWSYVVGGSAQPAYTVGTNGFSATGSENFQVTKLYKDGEKLSLSGLVQENGPGNTTITLLAEASDPFWGRFKDMGLVINQTPTGASFQFKGPNVALGDEIQDGLRDRALTLLNKAFLQGDPVALSEIGAAVGLVVGTGALIYSGALDNTFLGPQTKAGIPIPIGINTNIIKTGRQRVEITATPVITIGSHQLDVGMRDAGVKYQLNHQYFLFKAEGVYNFTDKDVQVKSSINFWGDRGNISIEHDDGLGDPTKTATKFSAGIGGPINGHMTWHADYSGNLDAQGNYAGSSVSGRIGYNMGDFQHGLNLTVGAGVNGLGVSKDAVSPFVNVNAQYHF